jgi:hypothetical protein
MDWTSIFVEDGSEDLIIPRLMDKTHTTSRLSRLVSRVYHHQYDEGLEDAPESPLGGHRPTDLAAYADENSAYSLRAVYYLSINYILGVGCLGIPFAFAKAGFLLCFVILSVITVFSFMTVMWVAETGARFQEQIKENIVPSEESSLLEHPSYHAGLKNRYEVIDLVDFYLGRTQKMIYQISLMALMYIGLLAYSQVFCGAIAAVLPGGDSLTVLPQIIFGAMVLPLSCMDLEEQLAMQTVMAAIRFVAISVIVFGSLFALIFDGSNSNMENPPFFATPDENGCKMSYLACFDGFGIAFSTCMFSQLFQHSIPGLLRPLNDYPDKLRKAPVRRHAREHALNGFSLLMFLTTNRSIVVANLCSCPTYNIYFLRVAGNFGGILLWCRDEAIDQSEFRWFHVWPRRVTTSSRGDGMSPSALRYRRDFPSIGYHQRISTDCEYSWE